MTLLIMVFRKMFNNRRLVLALLLGLIISVALISSMPLYVEGVLQRLLTKDMEAIQADSGYYPGHFLYKGDLYNTIEKDKRCTLYDQLNAYLLQDVPVLAGVPHLAQARFVEMGFMSMLPDGYQGDDKNEKRIVSLGAKTDLQRHITIVDGRMPSDKPVDGVYETLVTEGALNKFHTVLGKTFVVTNGFDENMKPIRVRPVGVFQPKDERDLYWFENLSSYNEKMLMDYNLFQQDFMSDTAFYATAGQWYYAFDHTKFSLDNIHRFLDGYKIISKKLVFPGFSLQVPAAPILEQYFQKEQELRTLLWAMNMPVILMLCFYVFMVSSFKVNKEKSDIAVLQSRGADRGSIMLQYLVEGLLLAGVALLAGPPLGLLLCRMLGASNGFLEFIQRKALPVRMTPLAYKYAAVSALVFIIAMLLPVYFAAGTTIVNRKQEMARETKATAWQRYFLDVILLAVSIYGLYTFELRQKNLEITAAEASQLQIDPLLFIASTLFVLGMGLLLIRIVPLLIRIVYAVGNKLWSPALYATMLRVGRSSHQYQFLMVFLIMTIAIGIFSANAARTINTNAEDKVRYANGADMVIQAKWQDNAPPPGSMDPSAQQQMEINKKPIQYVEPPFEPYTKLQGIEEATKVFTKDKVAIRFNNEVIGGNSRFMAVISDEFGRIAFRPSIISESYWNSYLNLLAVEPSAALISRSLSEAYNIKRGDYISVSWQDQNDLQMVVFGIIDYWPTWNPKPPVGSTPDPENPHKSDPFLVVGNLSYFQYNSPIQPYQVWLKKQPEATSAQVYDGIRENRMEIVSMVDTEQDLIRLKNDPFQLGINGTMTLNFVISMVISLMGFILYWVISLSDRAFEFGVLRAIGLSFKELVGMMVWEQLLSSGVAMIIGVIVGQLTSRLYVPMFQITYSAAEQVPPFHVVSLATDQIKVYGVMIGMLLIGVAVLTMLLRKLRINEALKMGEE
ncbi:ABC transporter permease [Mahella australiensis]|uniref:ABC3 transporter permease C-terminal domain-containing protein n=1 Tax=Mahella australiensis (strain DSM 15567 / CIP 107919 / 50-1 BON) TaxID=697281 RepID=F3ZYC2_MAHA5|nr:ABC transporter permease [Mahella australiensis]AEE95647.1 protein of unknown function DUF214 [Mahella australiensis 50-1 BON]